MGRARDGHIDDHHAGGILVAAQVRVGDHPADVVAGDHRPVQAEVPDQAVNGRCEFPLGPVGGASRGLPDARQVDRDCAEFCPRQFIT